MHGQPKKSKRKYQNPISNHAVRFRWIFPPDKDFAHYWAFPLCHSRIEIFATTIYMKKFFSKHFVFFPFEFSVFMRIFFPT
jgi:hypothetical protein